MPIGKMKALHVYHADIKVKNEMFPSCGGSGGIKKNIEFFSHSSRRRLLFICRNSGHYIKSQTLLTYHNCAPLSGTLVKKQLHQFTVELRKRYKGIKYLWVLEFHKSGAPHVHFFSDLPYTAENCVDLGIRWNRITGESEMHREFHTDIRNMRAWDMQSGKYLAKQYLAKANQKEVPEVFHNVGRFWGASRSMSPRVDVLTVDQTENKNNLDSAIINVVRFLTRRYEKVLKQYGIKRKYRGRVQSYSLPSMASNFRNYLEHLLCTIVQKPVSIMAETI